MTVTTDFPIGTETIEPERDEAAIAERLSYLKANLGSGFTQMPDAARSDPALSRSAKLVYEQLLYYMRQREFCWPSQERIASDLGTMSRRTVIRALNELYERGYIERWRRGLNMTNMYFLNPLTFVRSFRTRPPGCNVVPADDIVSGKCQIDTSKSVTLTLTDEPSCHTNQTTNLKQIHASHIRSNHSTAYSGTAIGSTDAAGGTRTEHTNDPQSGSGSNPNTEPSASTKEEPAAVRASRAQGAQRAPGGNGGVVGSIAAATGIPAGHLEELGVKTQPKRRAVPDFIANVMTDLCLQLGDKPRSAKSSITRAAKIYYTACAVFREFKHGDDPEGLFLEMLYQARAGALSAASVRHRGGSSGNRINRMPLFFTCLENLFRFQPEELEYLRSDGPLML